MKLNFWQILGAVLLAIGLIVVIKRELFPATAVPTPASTTTPAMP